MRSIRTRLLAGLLALVAVTTVCAGVITYERMLAETSSLFDYQLRQMALSLRDEAAIGPGIILPSHPSGSDFIIQIWDATGTLTYWSRPGLPRINRAVLGYADMRLAGERWRVYSLETAEGVIQVAQPWQVREELARDAALRVLVPLLLLLITAAAAVVWIVSRGLAPLQRLAAEVQRRDVHSFEPIVAPELPQEAAPLIEELNRLLARLSGAFGKQRAFVADAAHELRSPLTALSLQLQLLDRARDEAAREEARARLGAAVERAIHLASQLLTLARSEPEGAPMPLHRIALEPSARAGIADVHALAAERSVELSLEAEGSAEVTGDADALRILVRNLVDNAVRYTPAGGRVHVHVRTQTAAGAGPGGAEDARRGPIGHEGHAGRGAIGREGRTGHGAIGDPGRGGLGDSDRKAAVLEVHDTGPGIPAGERERAFDRFVRRPDATDGGTGLGLAIVKAIADRHGARVRLADADPHGLRVVVEFPPAGDGDPSV